MQPRQNGTNRLFPVFLKIEELDVLLVGGGKVGLEKLNAILQNAPGAAVWVVATEIADDIKKLAAAHPGAIQLEERPFQENDLDNKEVVIVAVNDPRQSAIMYGCWPNKESYWLM